MNTADFDADDLPSYEKEFLKLALLPWVEITLKFWAMDQAAVPAFLPELWQATVRFKQQQAELAPLFPSLEAMHALEMRYLEKMRITDLKPFFPDER